MADEKGMTQETLLASLHPDRLPQIAAGGLISEMVICIAIGLFFGTFLGLLLPKRQSLRSRLRALAALNPEERRLALLYLLKEYNPAKITQWRDRLYRPGKMPKVDEIEGQFK